MMCEGPQGYWGKTGDGEEGMSIQITMDGDSNWCCGQQ